MPAKQQGYEVRKLEQLFAAEPDRLTRLSFEVAGLSPPDVVARLLDRKIVATTTPYSPTYARLATGLMNDPDEVDTVLREVRALA